MIGNPYFWIGLLLVLFVGLPLSLFLLRALFGFTAALIGGVAHGLRHHEW